MVYDGSRTAALSGTAILSAVVAGETVTLDGTPVATFDNKNIGTAKPVSVIGYTLSGDAAANYTLNQPSGLSADITAAGLTITGVSAVSRISTSPPARNSVKSAMKSCVKFSRTSMMRSSVTASAKVLI